MIFVPKSPLLCRNNDVILPPTCSLDFLCNKKWHISLLWPDKKALCSLDLWSKGWRHSGMAPGPTKTDLCLSSVLCYVWHVSFTPQIVVVPLTGLILSWPILSWCYREWVSPRSIETYEKGLKKKFHIKSRSKVFQVCSAMSFCHVASAITSVTFLSLFRKRCRR